MEYEPPKLKKLGDLTEITKGPSLGHIDGLFGAPGGFQPPAASWQFRITIKRFNGENAPASSYLN